ncbi:MAG: hypothetical protein ACOYT8_02135 [Candidatus Dependentiae bacterium]
MLALFILPLFFCSLSECMYKTDRITRRTQSNIITLANPTHKPVQNNRLSLSSDSPITEEKYDLRLSNGSNPITIDRSHLFDAARNNDFATIEHTRPSLLKSARDKDGNNLLQVVLAPSRKRKPNVYLTEFLVPHTNFFHKNNQNKTTLDYIEIENSEYNECAECILNYLAQHILCANIGKLTFGELKILSVKTSPKNAETLKLKYALVQRYFNSNQAQAFSA